MSEKETRSKREWSSQKGEKCKEGNEPSLKLLERDKDFELEWTNWGKVHRVKILEHLNLASKWCYRKGRRVQD